MDGESEAESLFRSLRPAKGWSELPNPFGSPPRGDGKQQRNNGIPVPIGNSNIWGFPKNRGKHPQNGWWKYWKTLLKWMIWGKRGGNSNIFLCSSRTLGKMNPIWRAYFSEGLVQPPTSNSLYAASATTSHDRFGHTKCHDSFFSFEVPWLLKARTVKICAGEILLPSGCSSGRSSSFAWSKWSVSPNSNECSDVFLTSLILCFEVSKVGFFNEYIRDQEEFDVKHINSSKLILPLRLS